MGSIRVGAQKRKFEIYPLHVFSLSFHTFGQTNLINMPYYPLATGNSWTYKMKDGNSYTNEVTAADGTLFTMKNSLAPNTTQVRKDGDLYTANHWDGATFQTLLKDTPVKGDSWEVKFTANGLESILIHTVKDTGLSKEVNGTSYNDVILVEAESRLLMNGNIIPLNYFTQYYYANGTGLILTTTSAGDEQGLTGCKLN